MRLRGTSLFLDAPRPAELAFVSHAHADHAARHRQVIATSATIDLLAHRFGASKAPLPAPYRKPFAIGALELELIPSGHVLGAAQLRATLDGSRIVYTGDLNPVPSLAAEPCEVATCDLLVIESTFGHPRFRFPPREEVHEAVRAFARGALEDGVTPVLFAYSLGKGQEAIRLLSSSGFSVAAHTSISEICEVYARHGCELPHRRFDGALQPNEVLVFPPHLARARALTRLGRVRTAILTGWAIEPGARYRYGTDEAIPLSDHADFEALVGYVRASGARRVVTVHGFAKELAAWLRDHGVEARPLEEPRQMELF
jgi:putative mRNA 3-end processing factor